MSKNDGTFEDFLAEWTGKLAWAPYARAVGLADLEADCMTDEAELAQFLIDEENEG